MNEARGLIDEDVRGPLLRGAPHPAPPTPRSAASASPAGDVLEPLPEVEYRLLVQGQPSGWEVHHVSITEAVSELYELVLDLVHAAPDADPDALLEAPCTLEIARGPLVERRHGEVRRVTRLGATNTRRLVRVSVAPALHRLSQSTDSRIFQDLTALEAVTEVLREHGVYPLTLTLELRRECPKREYCVQYQESALAFVMRLLEEEGVTFHFRHEEGDEGERLVLTDHAHALAPVPTLDGAAAPVAGPESATLHVESVRFFDSSREVRPTGAVLRDFDWTRPGLDLTQASAPDAGPRGVYEYPAALTLGEYRAPNYTQDDRVAQARLRHEARVATARTAAARTNLVGARAGAVLEITGHGDGDHDGRYLVVRAEHTGAAPDVVLGATQHDPDDHERYRNELVCVPAEVPYRPERWTPRPRVSGVQTATVVGPPGEEIYTDEHGRVKVQFHWDRRGRRDERSSCWIRVMQAWSGAGFGAMFLPRVGMEVVVDFLEGDPDRPLVVGCVYNGQNRPPYELPAEKTRSTLKTNSSPGGNGYNELRFEDLAGHEEVSLHAQRDLNEVVENDHSTTVHANQTTTVDKNVTVHIKGSQSIVIDGTQQGAGHPVKGAGLNVTGKYKVDASDTIEVQAPTHIKLTCGGSSILIEPGKITLSAGGGAQVVLDANALMQSSQGSKALLDANANLHASGAGDLLLDANANLTSSAGSQVLLDANAKVASSGGSEVLLDANALVHASGGGTVHLTADAEMSGADATMSGEGKATVSGGEATLSGGTTNVTGGGSVTISGGVVAIN